MKKILMVSAVALACAAASPAFAALQNGHAPVGDDGPYSGASQTVSQLDWEIEGGNPAKCGVAGADPNTGYVEVTLADDLITDSSGFVRSDLADSIASALNGIQTSAWCTGNHNTVNLTRSALYTGDGLKTNNGFYKSVVYDLAVNIAGATRADAVTPLEDTVDGIGSGPTNVSSFGPSGPGATISFVKAGTAPAPADAPEPFSRRVVRLVR